MKNNNSINAKFIDQIGGWWTIGIVLSVILLVCWPTAHHWYSVYRGNPGFAEAEQTADTTLVSSRGRVEISRGQTAAAMTRPIETLKVGDRVLAHNPEVSQAERDSFVEPQWNEWLKLSLAMPKPDGSLLEIELLRPEAWVREQMALVIARSESKASSIAPPLAPYSGRGVGGEGQTEATNTLVPDLTTDASSDYEDLVPYSPLRPIFRDLAFAGAELEISGKELQAIFVEMDLPELAITGPAIVHEIRNAPTVKPGAGRVITATFHHSSGDVIDLIVGDAQSARSEPTALAAGGPEDSGPDRHEASQLNRSSTSTNNIGTSANNIGTRVSFERPVLRSPAASAVGSQGTDQIRDSDTIGTTSNHPFWSVDRQEYVQAGQLSIGERLQTFSGDTKRVVSKLARPGPQPVYNLEVFAEHVYYVGKDGLLVHNSGDKYGGSAEIYEAVQIGHARATAKVPFPGFTKSGFRFADGVRGETAYEAKFVSGTWKNSLYNLDNFNKSSRHMGAVTHLYAQMDDYAREFRQVVYMSNSKAMLAQIRWIAKQQGYTNIVTRHRR